MRVLIVGGTGIISTGITRLLIDRGDDVVLYNRGQRPSQIEGPHQTITGDRKAYSDFETRMREAGPFDCIIDMICYLPEEAESAIRAFAGRTDHYIFCSTVDVYTKPAAAYPISESAERLLICRISSNPASSSIQLPYVVLRPAKNSSKPAPAIIVKTFFR